ncbi:nicotinate-nicotinamide nucleotide adenylyltransferase [Flaviaesturariibacter terrae]
MTIGLYFGSFNPIHTGHLIIASHVLNEGSVDKVWFMVSPQNPFKPSGTLLNEYDRLHLVQKAIEGDDRLRASEVEFALPRPSYTAHTLAHLADKYPTHRFRIIMGSDSFQNITKWKNAEAIIRHYPILVYERPGFPVTETHGADVQVLQAPLLEISATHIRKLVQEGKSIRYLVPETVAEEIAASRFYAK